jgi:hypothetical protein
MNTKAIVLGLGLVALGLPACQKYQNYPAVATARGTPEEPNNPATEAAIVAALQYVATRFPPDGGLLAEPVKEVEKTQADFPFAVNLPAGMRKSFYERIPTKVGPEVKPLTPDIVEQNSLPIYHVTRVWLRFNSGTVDVLRPVPGLGKGPDGSPVYQKITLRLEGGFSPWRVVHARAWEPGTDDPPPYYYLPDIERVEQFKYSTAMTPEEQNAYDLQLLSKPQPIVTPPNKVAAEPTAE